MLAQLLQLMSGERQQDFSQLFEVVAGRRPGWALHIDDFDALSRFAMDRLDQTQHPRSITRGPVSAERLQRFDQGFLAGVPARQGGTR
ncbi:hypothetical protein D3C85_1474030 [compost metagenome]